MKDGSQGAFPIRVEPAGKDGPRIQVAHNPRLTLWWCDLDYSKIHSLTPTFRYYGQGCERHDVIALCPVNSRTGHPFGDSDDTGACGDARFEDRGTSLGD